jgi:hypothetical protein
MPQILPVELPGPGVRTQDTLKAPNNGRIRRNSAWFDHWGGGELMDNSKVVDIDEILQDSLIDIEGTVSIEWENSDPGPMAIGTIVGTILLHC